MNIKKILSDEGEVIALIIKKQGVESINFITPENFPFQLGISKYKKDSTIKPHIHKKIKRVIEITQEVVYIEDGKVLINFYDNDGKSISSETLESGDLVFFARGGHGFKIIEDTKIIEVKQGPYFGVEAEKIFLEGE